MTTAPNPHARTSSFAQQWQRFRQWRRGRPFWGGLLVILSGIVIFFSGRLDLGLDVHFGQEGFLATIIPAAMVLAGLLLWISPAQRLFYGILAALIAVYSLIGVNLGGWLIGMLLGIVGGSLGAAWSPETSTVEPASTYSADDGLDGIFDDDEHSGMLTDELPTRTISPLHEADHTPRHAADEPGGGAGSADQERPPIPPLPRRDVRGVGHVIAAVLLAGTLAAVVHQPSPASAAPACPPAGGQPAPNPPAGGGTGTATAPAPGTPTLAPTPTPSTSGGSGTAVPERDGPIERIVGGVVDFFRGLFGGNNAAPAPAPAASESATPQPSGSASATTQPTAKPPTTKPAPVPTKTASTACPTTPPKPRVLAAAPGQPPVAQVNATMLADSLTMSGLSFDGVVNLPTSTGTVRVLQFSMRQSVATPFELRVGGGPKVLSLKSSRLTVEGNVKFYTAKFSGNLLCLIPVTFTPDSPPPLILPELLFCNANITLNYVQSDVLRAPNLNIAFAT